MSLSSQIVFAVIVSLVPLLVKRWGEERPRVAVAIFSNTFLFIWMSFWSIALYFQFPMRAAVAVKLDANGHPSGAAKGSGSVGICAGVRDSIRVITKNHREYYKMLVFHMFASQGVVSVITISSTFFKGELTAS
jgi:hypothetical protein